MEGVDGWGGGGARAKPKRGENEPGKRNGIAVALNFSISFNLHEAHRRRTQEIFESTPPAIRWAGKAGEWVVGAVGRPGVGDGGVGLKSRVTPWSLAEM